MSIPGQQVINIGLPNEPTNSDSLYTAFTKANVNFTTLFNSASPYNTFTAGAGIGVTSNANTGTVTVTNTGVTNIIAGTNIVIDQANGNVTISSTGGNGNGGGTVTSVGLAPVSATRLTVTGSPIVSSGVMNIDLATSGVTAGSYSNPNVTIDAYGRVTAVANGTIAGTVTSVGLVPGSGIQVSGGPITSNGNITVTNTGVTRLNAGAGILLSSGNGNVTISANTSSGTVTAVGVTSSQLVVTGSPVVSSGTIAVNLPNSATFSGNVTAGNVYANSGTIGASLLTGTLTTAAQPNITSTGTLTSLTVTGNAAVGNVNVADGRANVTGNANAAGAGATVGIRSILNVESSFGSNDPNNPASAQAVRGRITGTNLTGNSNYLTGVTGQYLITGTNASDFLKTGVLGVVGDQTTTADAAVVAYLDGDGGLTTAGAAYGVSMKNSTSGSGFDYGLDLQWIDLGLTGLDAPFKQADIRFNNGVELVANVANAVSINANITLGALDVTNNANVGGALDVTGNTTVGNLIIPSGNIIYTPRYGSFYSNVTQTNPVANTAMAMTFNNSYSANGVSITSSSRLTVAKAGIYNIQFSAQCTKTDAGTDYIEIWLSKNGTNVPSTNTRLKLEGSNVYQVASWNFVETLGASEYVQLMWGSADLNAQLVAIPSGSTTMGIDVPSVIVTVTPVGA
jgi:hypothetical protein